MQIGRIDAVIGAVRPERPKMLIRKWFVSSRLRGVLDTNGEWHSYEESPETFPEAGFRYVYGPFIFRKKAERIAQDLRDYNLDNSQAIGGVYEYRVTRRGSSKDRVFDYESKG